MAQDDSASSPDFKHINNRQTSMSLTSLLVIFLFFVGTTLVASTEFLGKVTSFFSSLGTFDEGLAGVELGGGTLVGV